MGRSPDLIKKSLWRRLETLPELDLSRREDRQVRVSAYLDRWILSLEPRELSLAQDRMHAAAEAGTATLKLFLEEEHPELATEWSWFLHEDRGEFREAALRQTDRLWDQLWSLRWKTTVKHRASEQFSFMKEELSQRLEKLEEAEKKFKSLFGPRDLGWDLESGEWLHRNMEKLWELAGTLTGRKDLQRLARLLGKSRQGSPKQPNTSLAEEAEFYEEGEVQPGRTEIHGLKRGGGMGEILPQEMALLALPEAADLFWQRWGENSLLGWDYKTRQPQHQNKPSLGTTFKDGGGPILVCLDTSGSMRGKPEQIAKALVLALVKECLETSRPLYLINYSLELRTLELTGLKEGLSEFLDFLGFSFYGGTDLNPALAHGLEVLERSRWEGADVLVVSDFSQPKLRPGVMNTMKKCQAQKGTKFYCLSVSQKSIKDLMNIFDGAWVYNLNPKRAEGIDGDTLKKITS